ncbi:hypothetical protein, conserved [Babesia bigemina]|uniref:Uncharacterized protein n=1 Tax=Babesia bigemina TaxID=5866 RepID=A0A061DB69_BABBI|nr:hypothetical protein, conserved [Babesia bigemina]CDR94980.1 hypothetical protein, conserved [Babesia bigemina]|eukprot:XP_012767166.1 hypothetical protein, conserved [Babesia bigemina]
MENDETSSSSDSPADRSFEDARDAASGESTDSEDLEANTEVVKNIHFYPFAESQENRSPYRYGDSSDDNGCDRQGSDDEDTSSYDSSPHYAAAVEPSAFKHSSGLRYTAVPGYDDSHIYGNSNSSASDQYSIEEGVGRKLTGEDSIEESNSSGAITAEDSSAETDQTSDEDGSGGSAYQPVDDAPNTQSPIAASAVGDNNVREPVSSCSTELRCRILQGEIRILRNEKADWLERERELVKRVQQVHEDLKEQRKKLLDRQRKSQALEQEVELLHCRYKTRQETLEQSYKTLCENVRLTDLASLKGRLDLRRLQTKNMLLEELLQTKTADYERLKSMASQFAWPADMQMKCAPSSEATCGSSKSDDTAMSTWDGEVGQHKDPVHDGAAIDSGNADASESRPGGDCTTENEPDQSCEPPEEHDAMSRGDDPAEGSRSDSGREEHTAYAGDVAEPQQIPPHSSKGVETLHELSQLMRIHLKQMIGCAKEAEKQMRESVDAQIEELKELLQQTRSDLAYKTEECNVLSRTLEGLRSELDIARSNLSHSIDEHRGIKEKYQCKLLEVEKLQNDLDALLLQYEEVKRELSSTVSQGRQQRAAFDEYVKDTDMKLHKMEVLLSVGGLAGASVGALSETAPLGDTNEPNEDAEADATESPGSVKDVDIHNTDFAAPVEGYSNVARRHPAYQQHQACMATRTNNPARNEEIQLQRALASCNTHLPDVRESDCEACCVNGTPNPETQTDHMNDGVENTTPSSVSQTGAIDTGKMQEIFKGVVVRLLKKVETLTQTLTEQVVRAFKSEQRVKELESGLKPVCLCRKSLERVEATKRKRCWCRYKRVAELRRNVTHSALLLDKNTISAVLAGEMSCKKRKVAPPDTTE